MLDPVNAFAVSRTIARVEVQALDPLVALSSTARLIDLLPECDSLHGARSSMPSREGSGIGVIGTVHRSNSYALCPGTVDSVLGRGIFSSTQNR